MIEAQMLQIESDAILDHFRPFFALAPGLNGFLMSKNPYIRDFMFLAQKLPPQFKIHFSKIFSLANISIL